MTGLVLFQLQVVLLYSEKLPRRLAYTSAVYASFSPFLMTILLAIKGFMQTPKRLGRTAVIRDMLRYRTILQRVLLRYSTLTVPQQNDFVPQRLLRYLVIVVQIVNT